MDDTAPVSPSAAGEPKPLSYANRNDAKCSSTLFLFYDRHNPDRPGGRPANDIKVLQAMGEVARQVDYYARQCYGSEGDFDYDTLSVYTPLSLYQAGVVFLRLWRMNEQEQYREALFSLREKLRWFSRRWDVARELLRTRYIC
jgi:hypothetical protein